MNEHDSILASIPGYPELRSPERRRVDQHAQTCDECAAALQRQSQLRSQLAQLPRLVADPAAVEAVRAAIRQRALPASASAGASRGRRWLTVLAPAGAIALMLFLVGAWAAWYGWLSPSSPTPLARTNPTIPPHLNVLPEGDPIDTVRLQSSGLTFTPADPALAKVGITRDQAIWNSGIIGTSEGVTAAADLGYLGGTTALGGIAPNRLIWFVGFAGAGITEYSSGPPGATHDVSHEYVSIVDAMTGEVLLGATCCVIHDKQNTVVARSAEVSEFVWQTDGAYGYQMLRPAGWTMSDTGSNRDYTAPGSGATAVLALHVLNLRAKPVAETRWGIGAWLDKFDAAPTLEDWVARLDEYDFRGAEKAALPEDLASDAVIYIGQTEAQNIQPMAFKVSEGQPLLIALTGGAAAYDLDSLKASGLWDDFLTMLRSARPIPIDAEQVTPWAPTATPTVIGAPTVAPASGSTALPGSTSQPAIGGLTDTWHDYETALVRATLPGTLANGVCDWHVLGFGDREVYVWAFCAANQPGADITAISVPAVLRLAADGDSITARIPRDGTYYSEDIRGLFPAGLQQRVFDGLSTETLARLEQHARRRLTLPALPPLGAAETIEPRQEVSSTGAHIDLYSGRSDNPRWELNELELEQLDGLLEGLQGVDCPPMPGQLGYRGVVVGLGMADESRMTAYDGTLWLGYAGANPKATCLADDGRSVERFLLGTAQPYVDPQVFRTITAGLTLPTPTPLVTPSPTPTLAPGFVGDGYEGFDVQFTRPASWELCRVTELSRAYCVKASQPSENPIAPPVFYFTLLPPGFLNEDASAYNWWGAEDLKAAYKTEIGRQFNSLHEPVGYNTCTRLPDVTIDGLPGLVVENESVWEARAGMKDRRVLIKMGEGALVLGTHYMSEEDLRTFEQVLASVRFGSIMRAKAGATRATPAAPTR